MDLREAESRLTDLDYSQGFSLIYSLLKAYDFPKASITRLKNGDFNTASGEDELLWKNRVWFRYVKLDNDLHIVLDDGQRDDKVQAARPRFLIATNDERMVAADRVTGQTLDIPLGELPRHVSFFWPWTGAERTVVETDRQADIKAAQRMAKLYEEFSVRSSWRI